MLPYISLFISGFVAATLFPASSEVLLLALLQQGFSPFGLWLAATLGNTMGSCLNWYMGSVLWRFQHRRWFPFTERQMAVASERFRRYGNWSLLFSWLPVVGDPLTLVAGLLRVRFGVFLVLVALGKGARYGALLWLSTAWI